MVCEKRKILGLKREHSSERKRFRLSVRWPHLTRVYDGVRGPQPPVGTATKPRCSFPEPVIQDCRSDFCRPMPLSGLCGHSLRLRKSCSHTQNQRRGGRMVVRRNVLE